MTTIFLSCLLLLPWTGTAVTAFVAGPVSLHHNPNHIATAKAPPTSTTLYYRDDVPPIGSTATWETPNDFQQFVTQCSIQSLLFLLDSLRDEHTVRWLNDFTDPVLQPDNEMATTATAIYVVPSTIVDSGDTVAPAAVPEDVSRKLAPKKVSLEQAALSALTNTEQLISEAIATGAKQKKLKNKLSKKTNKKKRKPSLSASKRFTKSLQKEKKTKGKKYPGGGVPKKVSKDEESSDVQYDPPTLMGNSGISSLYEPPASSGDTPTKQTGKASGSSNTATSGPDNKIAPYSPYAKKTKPQVPSTSKFAVSSSTSSLYSVPDPQQKKVKQAISPVEPKATPVDKSLVDITTAYVEFDNTADVAVTTPSQRKKKVLKYHGLAMLNCTRFPTWDAYFETLLVQPKELLTIESYHSSGPSYDLDIDPASLCRRMLTVRMQIAEEFEHDLEVIANMGGLMVKSYHKMQREIREQRDDQKLQEQRAQLEKQMPKSMEDSISSHNGATATDDVDAPQTPKPSMQRANLLFLDAFVSKPGADNKDNKGYAPSPLRKGNFDLLVLLATQEAIHRVLNDPSRQARKSAEYGSNQFLQDFYVTRLLSHFSGDQRYGRADDFLEDMLASTPRMIMLESDASPASGTVENTDSAAGLGDELAKDLTYLVDPVKVTESILKVRDEVALEWKEQLAGGTKEAHMAIQKLVLAKVMEDTAENKVVDPSGDKVKESGPESCFE